MDNLGDQRKNYLKNALSKEILSIDPIIQFERWYQDAEKAGIKEPNAMTLATVGKNGQPSARIVLLKGFGQKGFAFYTNYESKKGKNLLENPQAALVFWYQELERQIRIEGTVEKLNKDASMSYFHSRPKGSQISATASPQSQIITKDELVKRWDETSKQFEADTQLPLPDFWGGYVLKPTTIEFWQGRANRLHDRFLYTLSDDMTWHFDRLAP
ncbi:MAG: pyridoxamine 5'-phosphate oxidase [Saprospiraceae bacterium]|nr:pyridoxamine 5'-phosphate oxidase [Saprospiraceae bacterium]NNL90667.1 pyridoxamine 5'-phosphate oxidase [Saprospiraceae bacterium]